MTVTISLQGPSCTLSSGPSLAIPKYFMTLTYGIQCDGWRTNTRPTKSHCPNSLLSPATVSLAMGAALARAWV